mgnify:CR=1 FL=1
MTTTKKSEKPTEKPVEKAEKVEKVEKAVPAAKGPSDVASLRRLWPEVIEAVKKKRRLTWTLLS